MAQKVQVNYTKANLHHGQGFTLFPGANFLDADVFEKAKRKPGFARRIKQGIIVVVSDNADEETIIEGVSAMTNILELRKLAAKRGAENKELRMAAKMRIEDIEKELAETDGKAGEGNNGGDDNANVPSLELPGTENDEGEY